MLKTSSHLPRAVVLCVFGGSIGALSVVRTLGRAGVPITVVSEDRESLSLVSKYCSEALYHENFSANHSKISEFLIQYARRQDSKPLLFPTADPCLKMISDMREELSEYYNLFISDRNLIENLMDKRKFIDFADIHNFPVPKTYIPTSIADVLDLGKKFQYPIIIKPAIPSAWTHPEIQKIVNYKKAAKLHSYDELIEKCNKILKYNNETIIQEYVPGPDDNNYELQVYMNKDSEPKGIFSGHKIRIYPPYAGGGCFVESIYLDNMIKIGLSALKNVNYTGLANLDFKKNEKTNEMKLLEINPRISQWNILATTCGVNLPFIAYADTVGIPFAAPQKQSEKIKYVYLENDIRSFVEYNKNGDWTLCSWLCSLRGKKVFQIFAVDDLKPFIRDIKNNLFLLLNKILRHIRIEKNLNN
jgi:D-aspartate ligase